MGDFGRSYQTSHEERLKALLGRMRSEGSPDSFTKPLEDFLGRPGKRMRPLLLMASQQSFAGPGTSVQAVLPVAFALECFHAFILIHDDVIDGSLSRRGWPTLHKAFERKLGFHPHTSASLATVVGDLLFGYAMESFNDCSLEDSRVAEALGYFLRVSQDTGLGEAYELVLMERRLSEVREKEIEAVYRLKTTRYTIEAPLVIGAMLGEAPPQALEALKRFSEPVGKAFQIENDLHEVDLHPEQLEALAYDLKSGVKTLFMKRLYDSLDDREKEDLEELLVKGGDPGKTDFRGIADLIAVSGVRESLRMEVETLFNEARTALSDPSLERVRTDLEGMAAWIESHRYHSESAVPKPAGGGG